MVPPLQQLPAASMLDTSARLVYWLIHRVAERGSSRTPEVRFAGAPVPYFVLTSLGGRIEHNKRHVKGGESVQGIIGIVVVVIIVLVVLVLLGVI